MQKKKKTLTKFRGGHVHSHKVSSVCLGVRRVFVQLSLSFTRKLCTTSWWRLTDLQAFHFIIMRFMC